MSKDEVELEKGEDGVYIAKVTKEKKKSKRVGNNSSGMTYGRTGDKPKYILENNADEFLSGIDLGLDFIEKVVPRVERLLRLRG